MRSIANRKQRRAARIFLGLAALAVPALLAALWARPAAADHTRFWRQSDYQEFEKGTPHGVAVRSDGVIALAPKFSTVADPSLAYLRALRADSHGNVYAAGGSNAKVIRVDAKGQQTTVFDSMMEMAAQTLALDKADNLYVGTSPDGKVYKITPSGQRSVFFDPKSKYIWDLLIGPEGTLYVATGDQGKIFSVAPDGKGDVFYSSEETHIRALALDGKGNLIAGTEPDGWVMRIPLAGDPPAPAARRDPPRRGKADPQASSSAAGAAGSGAGSAAGAAGSGAIENSRKAYVLYETPKREITGLAVDPAGNIYVAAIGDKQHNGTAFAAPAQPTVTVTTTGQASVTGQTLTPEQLLTATNLALFPSVTSSAVYRIAADGAPQELWASPNEIVYALSLAPDGKVLLGIGNRGAVIELGDDGVFSRLANTESGQVTGFARAANGKIFVATANPGKLIALGPDLESEGTLESQTYDAEIFSRWGRLNWWGKNGATAPGDVQFYLRTGNTSDPSNNWSDWSGPYANGDETDSPAARFAQWKAVLHAGKGLPAAEIAWVDLAYLPKNVAPRVNAIVIQSPGLRVSSFGGQQSTSTTPSVQLRMPSSNSTSTSASSQSNTSRGQGERFETPLQGSFQKGFQAAIWSAEDDNDDELTYSVYFRGENETNWRLLKDHLDQRYYSWDSTTMPDGAYYLKVVASDEKSNPPQEALTGSRESERFVVDNTPPVIGNVTADVSGAAGKLAASVRFSATDSASPIVRALYSLDSGDWTPLRPVGGISDGLSEQYSLPLSGLSAGEHTVSVRVYDQFENEATGKTTFTAAAKR